MATHDFSTNLFNNSVNSGTRTIASNGRARLEESSDGYIYVVIDGHRERANKNDLFGINNNLNSWLDAVVAEYDKEVAKNSDINDSLQENADAVQAKMDENSEEASISHKIQNAIKKAIANALEAFRNFLAECGVSSRFTLHGDKRNKAENLNKDFWNQRMAYTTESNHEYSLLMENCRLVHEKGNFERQITFNNVVLER